MKTPDDTLLPEGPFRSAFEEELWRDALITATGAIISKAETQVTLTVLNVQVAVQYADKIVCAWRRKIGASA